MISIAIRSRKGVATFAAALVAAAVVSPVGLSSSGDSLDRFLANDAVHNPEASPVVGSPDVADALGRFVANTAPRPASDAFDHRFVADAPPAGSPAAPAGAGFDWTATVIGLAAGLGALLLAATGVVYARRGQLRTPRVG